MAVAATFALDGCGVDLSIALGGFDNRPTNLFTLALDDEFGIWRVIDAFALVVGI